MRTEGLCCGADLQGEAFGICHLTLNSDKTKIVYCKNANRKMKYANISFDYLGYTFSSQKSNEYKE